MKKVDTVVPFKKPDNDASGKEIKKKSNNSYHYNSKCLFQSPVRSIHKNFSVGGFFFKYVYNLPRPEFTTCNF